MPRFLAAFKHLRLLKNSRLALVEERWTAKLPSNRRKDNRLQSFVNLRNLATVDQFNAVNFDLRAAFFLDALMLRDFRMFFGDVRSVVALQPSCPNNADQRRKLFLHDRAPSCLSIVAMGSWRHYARSNAPKFQQRFEFSHSPTQDAWLHQKKRATLVLLSFQGVAL